MGSTPSTLTSVTIASGATVSTSVEQRAMNGVLVTVCLPAAMTNSKFHFQGSPDNVNWFDIYLAKANGNPSKYEINFAASAALSLDPTPFYSAHYVRLAVALAEGGDREFKLAFFSVPTQ
jgi:hypothetical protein